MPYKGKIRHDKRLDEYEIWRGSNRESVLGRLADEWLSTRPASCGHPDDIMDWPKRSSVPSGLPWWPYLEQLGVKKSGQERGDMFRVEKRHVEQAASDPQLAQAAEKLGLRLIPPPE